MVIGGVSMSVFSRVLTCFVLAVAALLPAAAQSRLDPELQRVMQDPVVKEDFTKIIRQAQLSETTLDKEKAALERYQASLDSFIAQEGFVVKVARDYIVLNEKEVERIHSAVALHILLNDDPKNPPMLSGVPFQLRMAIRRAMRENYKKWKRAAKAGLKEGFESRQSDTIAILVRERIMDVNKKNRKDFEREKERVQSQLAAIEANRNYLGSVVEDALAARDRAVSQETVYGKLNEGGFYVVRLSGKGWRKKYARQGERISGYQNFLIYIDPNATSETGQYLHRTYPAGFDVQSKFGEWIENKERESEKACASGPPACPCKLPPDIWDTVNYDVMAGPLQTLDEAMKISGRVDSTANLSPTGAKHWNYERATAKQVNQACGGR